MSYKNSRVPDSVRQEIIKSYTSGKTFDEVAKEYGVDSTFVRLLIKKNNIPDNGTGRFYQKYEILDDYAVIWIRSNGSYLKCLIDKDDVELCKSIGIWSVTKAGYISNCKSGIYLHRLVMNCPDGFEVDHINHNLLDNRKSQLRIATSSEQKMNTKRRIDNHSGQRGVYRDKARNRWAVRLQNSERRVIKRFDDYDDACNFAKEQLDILHGDYQFKGKDT